MCGRKCSLFPGHFGELIDFTHSLYIHYIICHSKDYVYGIMTLVCLPGLVLFILVLFYFIQIRFQRGRNKDLTLTIY